MPHASNQDTDLLTLDPELKETVLIHGRRYQQWSIDHGCSLTPVDEDESERLNTQHEIFQYIFNNRLIFPPLQNLSRVLDCGYGSAAWATAVAEQYPDCKVFGVDVAMQMMPQDGTPDNLYLQWDNLNEDFTFNDNEFDLVHSQRVVTGIKKRRWPSYIQDCARVTKPGGWLQFVELYFNIQSDNGRITDKTAIGQLNNLYLRALENTKNIAAPMSISQWMHNAGLHEIDTTRIDLPLNEWKDNDHDRKIGKEFGETFRDGLGGHSMLALTEMLNVPVQEAQVLVAQARRELTDVRLKPYIALYITIGRKPNS